MTRPCEPVQVIEATLRDAHADWFSAPAEAAEAVLADLADAGYWVVPLVGLTPPGGAS